MDTMNEKDLFDFAEYSDENAERIGYSNYSYWRSTLKTFAKNKIAVLMVVIMVVIMVIAYIQPMMSKYGIGIIDLYDTNLKAMKPNSTYWFGTDINGRDLWSCVWYGTRLSITLGIVIATINLVVGFIIGAVWGYVRKLDRLFTEIYNVLANVPTMILLFLFSYLFQPGVGTFVFAMTITGWLGTARYVRTLIVIIRDREYNLASRCLGTPMARMITKNLFPHMISFLILRYALVIPAVVGYEISMSFLGFGLSINTPSLGQLINSGYANFMLKPHLLFFPVAIVSIFTIAFYLVGNAFSDASDPRNHM